MSMPNSRRLMLQRLDEVKGIVERERKERSEFEAMGVRYPNLGHLGYDDLTITLFDRLANSPLMGSVWVALDKHFEYHQERPNATAFAHACNEAYKTWSWTVKRTSSEHKRYYEELASNLVQMAEQLALDPAFGAVGQMSAHLQPLRLEEESELEEYFEELLPEEGANIVFYLTQEVFPGFVEHSRRLAKRALEIATQPPLSQRPRAREAHRIFFVKGLSKWFEHHFKKPFHGKYEVIAAVGSALFPEFERTLTADDVSKAAKLKPEVSIKF